MLLVLGVLAAAFVATALSTQPAPSGIVLHDDSRRDTTTCDLGSWPTEMGGPHPALARDPSPGIYFWVDATAWHVQNLSGAPVELEINMISRPTVVVEGAAGSNGAESEPCEVLAMTFEVSSEGSPLAANQLLLGRTMRAEANPFLVERELGG
jgi:hypothetical protein